MKPVAPVIAVLLQIVILSANLAAQDAIDFTQLSTPSGLVASGTEATRAALVCFLEGPALDEAGNVFFSDITSNRILKMTAAGEVSVFQTDSGRANGNAFDAQGRLITCEGFGLGPGGRRRVVRTNLKDGQTTVLTDRYEGKLYNSPNDVCVDGKGLCHEPGLRRPGPQDAVCHRRDQHLQHSGRSAWVRRVPAGPPVKLEMQRTTRTTSP